MVIDISPILYSSDIVRFFSKVGLVEYSYCPVAETIRQTVTLKYSIATES